MAGGAKMGNPGEMHGPSVLHVVVGHGLPRYFLNTVRSVRAVAPDDRVLVIDNASPQAGLRAALQRLADEDPRIDLISRTSNELQNRKVGGLYQAYAMAFDYALAREFDLLHLLQGDFQLMWWDADLVARSCDLFAARPHCVNILMQFLSRDKRLTDDLAPAGGGLTRLRNYGLTDTGLYHLGRWRDLAMEFGASERAHARRYLDEGLEVLCHPWPTDAPIPWPAVIRNGRQRGREVVTGQPFLLKPLQPEEIASVKAGGVWLEDLCIPWGWICATPMWVSGLDSIDYWVMRYRDAKKNGWRHFLPRPEFRGVRGAGWRALAGMRRYRPTLSGLLVGAPVREIRRRLRR
jgi:Glycosyl transferase family 2